MKDTICALIKDDIQHSALMNSLEMVGFDTLKHTLHLSDSILSLLELDKSPVVDEVSRGYFDLVQKYINSGDQNLSEFTNIVYCFLEGFSSKSAQTSEHY